MTKLKIVFILILLVIYALLITKPMTLTTSDLGRHIKNGEILMQGSWNSKLNILTTNYYSYTYPNFPFINHHWLSGIFLYAVKSFFGFSGLSVFFIILSLATFLIFFHIAWKYSNFYLSLLSALIALPTLSLRIEFRPETFTYFFCGIFFWILINSKYGRVSERTLWLLPILELFWVNLHIFFFLGPILIVVFLFENLISKKKLKPLLIILLATILATLINPATLDGAIHPLLVYQNYGFRVAEEQSLLKIESIADFPAATYFKLLFAAVVISFFLGYPFSVSSLFLAVIFSALGWLMIRNFTLFGYFAFTILAINLKNISKPIRPVHILIITALLIGFILLRPDYWKGKFYIGLGLEKNSDLAAQFFLNHNLKGPIFNNYDIGGYLIYYLYPQNRVFVDNRPEAYPADFFNKIYLPMQEGSKWQEIDNKYHFNTIFFFRKDLSERAKHFLNLRSLDPKWAVVYLDDNVIILVKKGGPNQKIVDEFEIK